MAEFYDIPLGGQSLRVPAWATEETAKSMNRYSEASAKALNEMLRTSSRNNSVAMKNNELFKKMEKATRDSGESFKNTAGSAGRELTDGAKNINKAGDSLQRKGKAFFDAFDKVDVPGMVSAIAGAGAAAGVIGYGVKVLQNYTQNLMTLANTGIGLSQDFTELRLQASAAGMGFDNYTKLMVGNGDNLRALGESTTEGAKLFSILSRDVKDSARTFNNFGLTNTELNEVIMQEIELRRTSGLEGAKLQDKVAESMNELMVQTTGLSAITGQDRRELLMARQQAMSSGAASAYRQSLSGDAADNFGNIAGILGAGGEIGKLLGPVFTDAIAGNLNMASVAGGQFARLSAMPGGAEINELLEWMRSSFKTMDSEEFIAQGATKMAEMSNSMTKEDYAQLATLAALGDTEAAQIAKFYSELNGLSDSISENRGVIKDTAQDMRDNKALAIPAAVEDMVESIKGAVIDGINTAFENLGGDADTASEAFLNATRKITDGFQGGGVLEGLWETFKELDLGFQSAIAAVALFAGAISGGMLIRSLRLLGGAAGAAAGVGGGAAIVGSGPGRSPTGPRAQPGYKPGATGIGLGVFGAVNLASQIANAPEMGTPEFAEWQDNNARNLEQSARDLPGISQLMDFYDWSSEKIHGVEPRTMLETTDEFEARKAKAQEEDAAEAIAAAAEKGARRRAGRHGSKDWREAQAAKDQDLKEQTIEIRETNRLLRRLIDEAALN